MEQINKILISVVISTRNRANLLGRSIKSVLNQTYSNFELIIIDGESSDNTKEVVNSYKDSRIKYFKEKNYSAAYCINKGFSYCSGKYIAVLDDDDEFYETKLEKQLQVFENSSMNLGIVYCWEEFWDDRRDTFINIGKFTNRGNLYRKMLYGPSSGGGTLMMIKKEVIDKIGGYDESIQMGCDYQFNLNISKYYDHDFVPEVLVRTHWYHEYHNSTTQPGSKGIDYFKVIEYEQKMLNDHVEAFLLHKTARLYHYKAIISAASKCKNYRIMFNYYMKSICTTTSISSFLEVSLHTFKRLILSLRKI